MLPAGNLEDDFIHVPLVAGPGQPPPDDIGELLACCATIKTMLVATIKPHCRL
jgi:hypothetical protein